MHEVELGVRERVLSVEKPPACRLPGLLDDTEMTSLLAFARTIAETPGKRGKSVLIDELVVPMPADDAAMSESEDENNGDCEESASPEPGSDAWIAEQIRLNNLLNPTNFAGEVHAADDETPKEFQYPTGWIECSGPVAFAHRKVFLHHGGFVGSKWQNFRQAYPDLLAKLLRNMRQHGDAKGLCDAYTTLNVRCVEVHEYTVGGGLIDPAHTDVGSALTLAVQLSEAMPEAHGGRFTTTDPLHGTSEHPLERGDGLLACVSRRVLRLSSQRHATRTPSASAALLLIRLSHSAPLLPYAHHISANTCTRIRILASSLSPLHLRVRFLRAGLLFRSDLVHNVTPLTAGSRQSLVIELWDEHDANLKDRYT